MNSKLRQAAILVTSLDRASAEALLAQMPSEAAKRVLEAARSLGKIDPDEQREVMETFLERQGKKPAPRPASEADVELSLSETAIAAEPEERIAATANPPVVSQARFAFVTSELVRPLAAILGREQPQLAALVLAHLPPERSAAVLALLDPAARLQVVQRIAEIEETSSLVLDELEEELRARLEREQLRIDGSAHGLAALSGILQASDPAIRSQISSAIGSRRTEKATAAAPPEIAEPETVSMPSAVQEEAAAAIENKPAIAFTNLAELDDISLAAVFGSVSPKLAILALVGADESLVRRILRILPKKEAAEFRARLEEVGPLRLKEIELAQNRLSETAGDLLRQRRITIRSSLRDRLAA